MADLLLWAYALPELTIELGEIAWWEMLGTLKQARENAIEHQNQGSSLRLVQAAEIGLALALGLDSLPSSKRLARNSWEEFDNYLAAEDDRLKDALSDGGVRLPWALASALRCQVLGRLVLDRKLTRSQLAEINEMGAWWTHLVRWNGSLCFGPMDEVTTGALADLAAKASEDPGLTRAYDYALRKGDKGLRNRMSIEIELPESGMFCDQAKIVSLRPSWFRHHGWVVADFSRDGSPKIELSTGRRMLLAGDWETSIEVQGNVAKAISGWEDMCWFSDDDLHFIEMQQTWSRGITLQRQIMVIRDDGVVMLADTILGPEGGMIEYQSKIPVDPWLQAVPDPDIREIVLADNKPRAMILPVGLPEWRIGPSPGDLIIDEGHLIGSCSGESRLYAPTWFDMERRRFSRPRTWRNLTVATELQIAKPHEAVASRIQFGSEHWVIFRELIDETKAWSFCGRHITSDFFCARLDPEDGSADELLTVDKK